MSRRHFRHLNTLSSLEYNNVANAAGGLLEVVLACRSVVCRFDICFDSYSIAIEVLSGEAQDELPLRKVKLAF
jgi:hypothetical protein